MRSCFLNLRVASTSFGVARLSKAPAVSQGHRMFEKRQARSAAGRSCERLAGQWIGEAF